MRSDSAFHLNQRHIEMIGYLILMTRPSYPAEMIPCYSFSVYLPQHSVSISLSGRLHFTVLRIWEIYEQVRNMCIRYIQYCLGSLGCRDRRFESYLRHGCLFYVCVVLCR
jgi:hypothetical protein